MIFVPLVVMYNDFCTVSSKRVLVSTITYRLPGSRYFSSLCRKTCRKNSFAVTRGNLTCSLQGFVAITLPAAVFHSTNKKNRRQKTKTKKNKTRQEHDMNATKKAIKVKTNLMRQQRSTAKTTKKIR